MQINKNQEAGKLTLAPIGRVDTITSPELEAAIVLDGVEELVFDLSQVDYISSAGLRVLLSAQKKMASKSMKIANAKPAVKEVFDITGFSDIFTFA
ncbi:MAG: STAS domain-containing protein [bacterium]|nr:STAS domain-containing protein [Candidatus Colisoma equi]